MSKFYLGKRSLGRLQHVHPLLVACVCLAIKKTSIDFTVLGGLRTIEKQERLVKEGKSKTMDSKHLLQQTGYCHAVDLAPLVDGEITWGTWEAFSSVDVAMFEAAEEIGVELTWGGNWKGFKDGPHFQIEGV